MKVQRDATVRRYLFTAVNICILLHHVGLLLILWAGGSTELPVNISRTHGVVSRNYSRQNLKSHLI